MSSESNQSLEVKDTTLFDRIFRDSEGNIVIAQPPNLPVLAGVTAVLLQFLLPSGQLQMAAELFAFGALFTWAWQELFDGVNYFRRTLGLIGLATLMTLGLNSLSM
ncbi:MAG: hypothetical protein WBC73_05200 [Phormidesmis sp.]